jgi:D-arabinitol dehydrogenase (NADP+)
MDLAKRLDSADVYIELSRTNPEAQFQKLKAENPYGFDIVVEASNYLEDHSVSVLLSGT